MLWILHWWIFGTGTASVILTGGFFRVFVHTAGKDAETSQRAAIGLLLGMGVSLLAIIAWFQITRG